MLVHESLDHLQITTGILKGERSVSSLIHCNCAWIYKQIVDTKKLIIYTLQHTHILGHTDVLERDI